MLNKFTTKTLMYIPYCIFQKDAKLYIYINSMDNSNWRLNNISNSINEHLLDSQLLG